MAVSYKDATFKSNRMTRATILILLIVGYLTGAHALAELAQQELRSLAAVYEQADAIAEQ